MMLQNEIRKYLAKAGCLLATGCICLPLAFSCACAEEDTDVYDATTETTVSADSTDELTVSTEEDSDNVVKLSSTCRYHKDDYLYYYLSTEYNIDVASSNVQTGDYVNGTVTINLLDGNEYYLYQDGIEVEEADLSAITEPGFYSFFIPAGSNNKEKVLTFTIVGAYTSLNAITIPKGCQLDTLTIDEEEQEMDSNLISLTEEGKYYIVYHNLYTEQQTIISTTVDRTAPVLALEAVPANGKAIGSVDISDLEAGATIAITLNGQAIEYSKQLTSSGRYHITVTDQAGNSNDYDFVILVHINHQGIIFLVLIIGIVASVIIDLVVSKSKMRVR